MLAQINQSEKPQKPNKLAIALGLLEPAVSIGTKLMGSPQGTGKLSDYAKWSDQFPTTSLKWGK